MSSVSAQVNEKANVKAEEVSPRLPYAPEDVLVLIGGAAQTTTHPGNLHFYKLCEDRFDEYKSLPDDCPRRQDICIEIIERCGTFRKQNFRPMTLADALSKCQSRMRQIARPKKKGKSHVGENDVVFTVGGTNHLYPGNAKFGALCDEYFDRYWPNLLSHQINKNRGPIFKKPEYQDAILKELVQKINQKGGVFRGTSLRVMSDEDAYFKIHTRFKDMKKIALKNGQFEKATAESYVLRRTGCTSIRVADDLRLKGTKKQTTTKGVKSQPSPKDDDEDSFDGGILSDSEQGNESDSDDEVKEDSEEEVDEEERRRRTVYEQRKLQQNISRRERLARRRQLQQNPAPCSKNPVQPQKKRRRTPRQLKERDAPPEETPDMSDYERLRVRNMQRNYGRLKKLGLV